MNLYREKARAAAAADVPRSKPGPPPAKTERVAGDMIDDVASTKFTVADLQGMTQEAMVATWETGSRETAVNARNLALTELNSGRTPTELRHRAQQLRQNSDRGEFNFRQNSDTKQANSDRK
jgi:hypothetical protein